MGIIYRVLSRKDGENVVEITERGEVRCFEIQTGLLPSQIPENCKLEVKDSDGDVIMGADNYGIVYLADQMYSGVNIPFIYTVTPADGAEAGGDEITIDGSNFEADATVTIDGDSCTSVVVDSELNQIVCDTPAGSAGVVALRVTNPNHGYFEIENGFRYRTAPIEDAVSPSTGNIGSLITLSGSGFFSFVGGEPTITVNSVACTSVVFYNSTKITCIAPTNVNATYDVVVTFADGQIVTFTNGFEYVTIPTVTSITPHFGLIAGGGSVSIAGTGFGGDSTVTIGGKAATSVVVHSAILITCTTPTHRAAEELVDVVVTSSGSAGTLRNGFEYIQQDSTTLSDKVGVDAVNFAGPGGKIMVSINSRGELKLVGQVVIGVESDNG